MTILPSLNVERVRELLLDAPDILDAVMNEVDLPAAFDFTQAGLAYHNVIPLGDKRFNGESFSGRRRDQ